MAAHLLAEYAPPKFMDSAWFTGSCENGAKQREWYRAMGRGARPRTLDFPIPLTRRMARCFLAGPDEYSVEEALRWGQIRGLGGSDRMIAPLLGSRIGTKFENHDFWVTVIQWLIQNPMFDPAQIAPMIDFIHHQKFERKPPAPKFTIKGRTATSLLRQMRQWHGALRKRPENETMDWSPSGIAEFTWTEGAGLGESQRCWSIVELTSRKELFEEGKMMRHCVASYDKSYGFGGTSIWSLGVEREPSRRRRVLTVEIANSSRTIRQARGRANRNPKPKEFAVLRRWAAAEKLALSKYVERF